MPEPGVLAESFEANRPRLRALAYRMLGSLSDADDAVQEAWLKLRRADAGAVENLGGWLTTVVARVCLDLLRTRKSRREDSLETFVPDPIVSSLETADPERETLLADSVGMALLVVLEQLSPAERVAFVLHDAFDLPFQDIAGILGRSEASARQLASRGRRRVQGAEKPLDSDLGRQRKVVEAFFAAARAGDFAALLAVLDPAVVARVDAGALPGGSRVVRGAAAVAEEALGFSMFAHYAQLALVNGAVGVVAAPGGRAYSVMAFTISGGRIVEFDVLADPERLARLDLSRFAD